MLFINAITLADSATVGDVQAQQEQKYAFKCHRRGDAVFPVNAMAFHPRGTFASGGCDGVVSVWDGGNKKRLWQTPAPYPTSIAALTFSGDACLLMMNITNSTISFYTPFLVLCLGGNKKRLWQAPAPYPTSIAALAFSGDACLPA